MKAVCEKHGEAYEVEAGCKWCEPDTGLEAFLEPLRAAPWELVDGRVPVTADTYQLLQARMICCECRAVSPRERMVHSSTSPYSCCAACIDAGKWCAVQATQVDKVLEIMRGRASPRSTPAA